jgi:hypothetical protein
VKNPKQIIELTITTQRPADAKAVPEQELELIGVFLSELLVEMLQHFDEEE